MIQPSLRDAEICDFRALKGTAKFKCRYGGKELRSPLHRICAKFNFPLPDATIFL